MTDGDLTDKERMESQVLLEEYKRLYSEILKRLDFGDKNINYQLILFGIIITAITQLKDHHEVLPYILLVSPFIFYILASYYSINNIFILRISHYINTNLRPRIEAILNNPGILKFEEFWQSEINNEARKSNKLVAAIVIHWTIFIPVSLLAAYLVLLITRYETFKIKIPLIALFILNIFFCILTIRQNGRQYNVIQERNKTDKPIL